MRDPEEFPWRSGFDVRRTGSGGLRLCARRCSPQAVSVGRAERRRASWAGSRTRAARPWPGAVISLFGKGMRGGGLVTLSDSDRPVLPALAARGLLHAARPRPRTRGRAARARSPCCPDRDSVFTVSLHARRRSRESSEARGRRRPSPRRATSARARAASGCCGTSAARSWRPRRPGRAASSRPWPVPAPSRLLASCDPGPGRHRRGRWPRRRGRGRGDRDAATLPTSLERGAAQGPHRRLRALGAGRPGQREREHGLAHGRGVRAEPVEGHEIQVGTGYGTRYVRPLLADGRATPGHDRSVGAVFAQDRWQLADAVTADRGRALLVHRLPGRRAPRRPVGRARVQARRPHARSWRRSRRGRWRRAATC